MANTGTLLPQCNILLQLTMSRHHQEGSKVVVRSEASLPGLVDLIICLIIRDMLSRRSSLVFGRHHPSRSVHSDSVPSFRWMIFCRLKSSKREGNISLLHSDVGFKWDSLWLTSIWNNLLCHYSHSCHTGKEAYVWKVCSIFIQKLNTSSFWSRRARGMDWI